MSERKSGKLPKIVISLIFLGLSIAVIFMVINIPAETVSVLPREVRPVSVEVLEIEPETEMRDILELPGSLEPILILDRS